MRKSWNRGAGSQRWAAWLSLVALLLLLASACTGYVEGTADPGAGSGLGDAPTGNQLMCQPGQTACRGACVDLQSANNDCGACGTVCTAPAVCASGSCSTACAAGFQKCGDACINFSTDSNHCGGCDKE